MGRARTGPLPAHSSHYRLDSPVGLDKMEAEMEGVDEQLEVGQCAVDDALARVLRIVLSSNQPIPHHLLKSKALGNAGVRDAR